MKYFKVLPLYDNCRRNFTDCTTFVANELYTEKEVQGIKAKSITSNQCFEEIQISCRKTYFFFGARFEVK